MKNVMKMFIAIAVMGVMTVSAFAQGAGPKGGGPGAGQKGGPGGQKGGQRRSIMNMDGDVLAKLKLTSGQQAKIKTLKETTQKKFTDLMKTMGPRPGGKPGTPPAGGKAGAPPAGGKPGGPGAGMREKFKPIMDSYNSGIKGILTPPQFTAYEKGIKEMREKMRAARGGGPGGPGAKGGPAGGKGKGKGTPPPTP